MTVPKAVMLPSGQWRCQVMVKGQRVSITRDSKKEAETDAIAVKAGLLQATKEKKDAITLTAAITQYIESREGVLSPSTIRGYQEIQRNRFQALMKKKVADIDEMVLQSAVSKEAKSVSYKTVKNALGLVVSVLSQYKTVNLKRIKLPQRIVKEHKFLDTSGIIELFEAIEGTKVEVPILLAVWLGMRRSEIFGLCWESIDFDTSMIKVEHTYVASKDGTFILRDQMKTEASRRALKCPAYIMQKMEAIQPDPAKRIGRVFTMHPNTLYKNMEKICKDNGIDFVGVHGLRHTNASVMLSLGIIDKIAMARGGWSTDVTMKSVYQHLFEADKQSANEAIDQFFEGLIR